MPPTNSVTLQEAFTQIVQGLASQGWQQSRTDFGDEGTKCAYRGSDGLRCAAGQVLSDAKYDPKLEGQAVHTLVDMHLLPQIKGDSEKHELWRTLQSLHDAADNPTFMRRDFYAFGRLHNLQWPKGV